MYTSVVISSISLIVSESIEIEVPIIIYTTIIYLFLYINFLLFKIIIHYNKTFVFFILVVNNICFFQLMFQEQNFFNLM